MATTESRLGSSTSPIFHDTQVYDIIASQASKLAELETQIHDLKEGHIKWQQTVTWLLSAVLANKTGVLRTSENVNSVLKGNDSINNPTSPISSFPSKANTGKRRVSVVTELKSIPSSLPPPIAPLSTRVLEIIANYGQHLSVSSDSNNKWAGFDKFLPKVELWVNSAQPVKMILPAFPWKSVNRIDKVLGALPDFGEELAMARLDNMCKDIKAIYPQGAEVVIATDGIVFNDLFEISNEETWQYGESLMDMAVQKGFKNLKFLRIMEILDRTDGKPLTKEIFMEKVDECRSDLAAQFGDPDKDIKALIASDEDTRLTYCGFLRFLELDLKYCPSAQNLTSVRQYKNHVKKVAMAMMFRAESFTKILMAKYSDYVRLSIHPSSGAVKLSIPLIPQTNGSFPRAPWQCAIAVGVDGSYKTVQSQQVRRTHTIIHREGRPYFFRENSDLYDWDEESFSLEHQYPHGLVISSKKGGHHSMTTEELQKVQTLAGLQESVVVQGFSNIADGTVSVKSA